MDRELERVIARLEARFDAALAQDEEEAARDLEASLRQDRTLSELVRAGVPLRLWDGDGSILPVTVVGADYCGTGFPLSCVRRLGSTPLVAEVDGRVPEARRDSLHEVARRWSRGGYKVQLGLETESLAGRLVQVGPDNLVLETPAGRTIVPLWLVRSIRLAHEG